MNTIHTSERGIRGKANIVLTLFSPLFFRHFTLCPSWLCPMLQHLCWPFVLSSQWCSWKAYCSSRRNDPEERFNHLCTSLVYVSVNDYHFFLKRVVLLGFIAPTISRFCRLNFWWFTLLIWLVQWYFFQLFHFDRQQSPQSTRGIGCNKKRRTGLFFRGSCFVEGLMSGCHIQLWSVTNLTAHQWSWPFKLYLHQPNHWNDLLIKYCIESKRSCRLSSMCSHGSGS